MVQVGMQLNRAALSKESLLNLYLSAFVSWGISNALGITALYSVLVLHVSCRPTHQFDLRRRGAAKNLSWKQMTFFADPRPLERPVCGFTSTEMPVPGSASSQNLT